MSKQFLIFATDADLRNLEEVLKGRGDVNFYSTQAIPETTNLIPLDSIVLPPESAGKQSLFCFLMPSNQSLVLSVERISKVKVSVDIDSSNLIDFWRPFFDGKIIRPGRMFYKNRFLSESEWVGKSKDFCDWADSIFFATKRIFHIKNGAYWGEDAEKRVAEGLLLVKDR